MKVNINHGTHTKIETLFPGTFFVWKGKLYQIMHNPINLPTQITVVNFNDEAVESISKDEIVQVIDSNKIEITVKE